MDKLFHMVKPNVSTN